MEITIGIILYFLVISLFVAFGKFLKNCDEEMKDCCSNGTKHIPWHRHSLQ